MSDLQQTIARIADQFATQILAALKTASLDELASLNARPPAGRAPKAPVAGVATKRATAPVRAKKGGKRVRRTAADLNGVVESIVTVLKDQVEGLRSEQLQSALGLSKKDIVGPIKHALENKLIRKKGQRRATTYLAK